MLIHPCLYNEHTGIAQVVCGRQQCFFILQAQRMTARYSSYWLVKLIVLVGICSMWVRIFASEFQKDINIATEVSNKDPGYVAGIVVLCNLNPGQVAVFRCSFSPLYWHSCMSYFY